MLQRLITAAGVTQENDPLPAGCPNVAWKIDSIRSQRSEPMELGAFYRFGGDFGG